MSGYYKLEGHKPVLVQTVLEWAAWFEKADRHVAKTQIGNVKVSTVFLGLDHNLFQGDRPSLFETMIFGGKHDDYQERYSTWEEAEIGHAKAVEMVRKNK